MDNTIGDTTHKITYKLIKSLAPYMTVYTPRNDDAKIWSNGSVYPVQVHDLQKWSHPQQEQYNKKGPQQ